VSETVANLRARSTEDLVEAHDRLAANTSVGVNYYLEELARRDSQAIADRIADSTTATRDEVERLATLTDESAKRTERLTMIVLWLTAMNVVVAIAAVVATIAG
jgi:hypothetical protein